MYYICELEMAKEQYRLLSEAAERESRTIDELFSDRVRAAVDHPDEFKRWKEEDDQITEEERSYLDQIKIIRYFPVEDGQTEEEARAEAISRERSYDSLDQEQRIG